MKNLYRVATLYEGSTAKDIRARHVTWNVAQILARDVRNEYSYSNGGARNRYISARLTFLGYQLPGPRPWLVIEKEDNS